jgi:hypothetical protein
MPLRSCRDYTLLPRNAAQKGKPYERIQVPGCGPYTIDALWGWTAVPAAAKTRPLPSRCSVVRSARSPFGISGSPQEQGEIRLLAQLGPGLPDQPEAVRAELVGGMKLDLVMDEVAAALGQITGLRMFAYPPPTVVPPAGIVSYPERIDYDQTYGRGMDRIVGLPVVLVVGKAVDRAARDTAARWAAGSGAGSVKAVLEAATYTTCDVLTVTSCSFDVVTIAGVDYIAAMFSLDIAGQGA